MRKLLALSLLFSLAVTAPSPRGGGEARAEPLRLQERGRLENALRGESASLFAGRRVATDDSGENVFGGDKLARVKHGALSVLVPGWSQWRAGHDGRALFFATTELVVWGTFVFSELQADHREDQYVDFAQQFASVGDSDQDDDYWRAVASHRSSREFNDGIRAEIRAGLTPEEALIAEENSWQWQSEQRFREFQQLRADALSAQDRADFVLVFALVNRLVAFVDAVRSGPPADEAELAERIQERRSGLRVDFQPDPVDPAARLSFGGTF